MDSLDSRFCCPAGRLEPVRELLFFCGRSVCSFSAYRIPCLTWLDVLEVEVKDGMVVTEPRFESYTCKCQFCWTKLDKFIPREHCARRDLIRWLPFTVPTTYHTQCTPFTPPHGWRNNVPYFDRSSNIRLLKERSTASGDWPIDCETTIAPKYRSRTKAAIRCRRSSGILQL